MPTYRPRPDVRFYEPCRHVERVEEEALRVEGGELDREAIRPCIE